MTRSGLCVASLGWLAVASTMGCAPAFRRDVIGRGGATIATAASSGSPDDRTPGLAATSAPGAGIVGVHAGDDLEIAWTITQPRAEQLRYAIDCGGTAQAPIEIGETFEAYRARRIAELRARRDRERAVVSSVASALVPGVTAQGTVASPGGTGTVAAGVDPNAVGDAIAAGVVRDDVALAPGDVGAGALTGTARITALADGPCTMTVFTDTPGVVGVFAVTRVTDLAAERRAHAEAQRAAAMTARGDLVVALHAAGAHDRIATAPAALPVPALDAEVRVNVVGTAAMNVRGSYVAYLVGECHADPHARAKARARAARRAQVAFDLRWQLYARLVALGADPERRNRLALAAQARARTIEAARARDLAAAAAAERAAALAEASAHATRAAMVDFLVMLGAQLRPPMPPPRPEEPGDAPFTGAVWIAGQWLWADGEWEWQAGGWRDGTTFGVDVAVDNAPRGPDGWTTRDHRDGAASGAISLPTADGWTTRDHRDGGPTTVPATGDGGGVVVRDHRDDAGRGGDGGSVVVRDHRDDRHPPADPPKDRAKDKDADKDRDRSDGVVVRDHRR